MHINDIVIIKDDGLPLTKWKLGRIIQVHPGYDNMIRVVTVCTSAGVEFKRPVVKLCVLPTNADQDTVETQGFDWGGGEFVAENLCSNNQNFI